MSDWSANPKRYLYWLEPERFPEVKSQLTSAGYKEYQEGKPDAWENAGLKDAVMFKILFTFTRFWGWGDNLKKHWIGHRANHANFLARHHVTEIDGEEVPFSVTGSERVCSSCAEVFNVVADDSRKLVNACPGAVTFGGADADTWVDVKPTGRLAEALRSK